DQRGRLFGYELLYRSGNQNCYTATDGDQATTEVIRNSFTVIGLDTLTGGRKAFINFTQNLLTSDLITLLPPKQVVIEILEDITMSSEVWQACSRLKELGYQLALDDFVLTNDLKPLVEFADIIKVDFMKCDESCRDVLINTIGVEQVDFLAEKVETREEYLEAVKQGFKYFQGYYFSKPVIMAGRDIPESKITYLRIVQEIYRPDFSFEQMEQIFKQNLALSYKLLRLVNSASFGLRCRVNSIKQALVMIGLNEIKRWVSLIAMQGMGEDKPTELVVTALIRANLCEALASETGLAHRSSELFLLGLFSLIDVILDQPMAELVAELSLTPEVREALVGESNPLNKVLDLVLFYEKGDWDHYQTQSEALGLESGKLVRFYLDSLNTVRKIMN
ncbi:MAG TPA: HDOD domain-containing protein, partial [Bacillota bacterium]|nr:HDOD domain-containing protein [Bacillota bacterium]